MGKESIVTKMEIPMMETGKKGLSTEKGFLFMQMEINTKVVTSMGKEKVLEFGETLNFTGMRENGLMEISMEMGDKYGIRGVSGREITIVETS